MDVRISGFGRSISESGIGWVPLCNQLCNQVSLNKPSQIITEHSNTISTCRIVESGCGTASRALTTVVPGGG